MSCVDAEGVSVRFDGSEVLHEVNLSVSSGHWLCLIGPNGAGKTTLLRSIAGLISFRGRVAIDDTPVARMNRRLLARSVAYVPQRPQIPPATPVTDYVLMGRTPYISYLGSESRRDLDVVADVLERLELTGFAARALGSLSGGELQRVVLGRALAQQAPVLLLDEPTGALDVGHQQQVLELVDSLRADHDLTVLSSMHDLTLAGQFADGIVLLDGGRVVAAGPARTVLNEGAIRDHYSASVRVLEDPDGGVVVVPMRVRRG